MEKYNLKTQASLTFSLPQPSKEYYDVISNGLNLHLDRKINYDKYNNTMKLIADGYSANVENIDYLPICADLELVNWCNIRCHMCPNTFQKNTADKHALTFDNIKQFIEANNNLIEVRIQGIGEPFLYADILIDAVKLLNQKHIWSRTTTNAILLSKNDNYRRIIDANIGEIGISIDGASKESYEKIRLGSDFELVIKNTALLNAYCANLGIEKTRMWVVAQQDNIHELFKFPYFAKELGFSRLTFSLNVVDWGLDAFNINQAKNIAVSQKDIDELLNIGQAIGVDISFWGHHQEYTKNSLCNWIFKRPLILADGSLSPCCNLPHTSILNFGNINDTSFKDLWLGDDFQKFRRLHLDYNIPDICKNCYDLNSKPNSEVH